MQRVLEIEVLRAVAVLFVLISHARTGLWWWATPFENYLSFSFGVDLFFCVSGFVITRSFYKPLSEAARAGGPTFWNEVAAFWIRRAYRIIPLAWLWLAIPLVMSITFNKSGYFTTFLGNIGDTIAAMLNVYNFHFAHCLAAPTSFCGPDGVYWSLSLEEQFYLVFPFLLLLPKRLMVLALLAAIFWMTTRELTTLTWMTRIDAICLGVLIAHFKMSDAHLSFTPVFLKSRFLRIIVTTTLIAALAIVPGPGALILKYPTLTTAICGALVFIASYDQGFLMQGGPPRKVLVWIGERSFALYLIHNPIASFVHELFDRLYPGRAPNDTMKAVIFVLLIALLLSISELSHRYFETPFRKRGAKVAKAWAAHGPAAAPDQASHSDSPVRETDAALSSTGRAAA
jgi:peptidoglycan/LPS O-acetylase OafA/YrhL